MAERRSGAAKLLLVCSSGGHLDQLFWLRSWWERFPRIWATFDKPDAVDRMRDQMWCALSYPTNRNIPNTLRNSLRAYRVLLRERPTTILSSGAGPAVPFFWIGKVLFRCRTIYLEPWDRLVRPTLTSRLIRPVTDLAIASSEGQLPRWTRVAIALAPLWRLDATDDRIVDAPSGEARHPDAPLRVLVTVGTHEEPFDRLIAQTESIASSIGSSGVAGAIEIACQHGVSRLPHAYPTHRDEAFLSHTDLTQLMGWADVVIAPASPGTAMLAFRRGCHLLLLPRHSEANEAVDDHQEDFMKRLELLQVAERLSIESFVLAAKSVRGEARRTREHAWERACHHYAEDVARACAHLLPDTDA